MPENDEDERETPYSVFRNFLIPDTQNILQAAAYRHELGDFDGTKEMLDLARDKIDRCDRQLEADRKVADREEGSSDAY